MKDDVTTKMKKKNNISKSRSSDWLTCKLHRISMEQISFLYHHQLRNEFSILYMTKLDPMLELRPTNFFQILLIFVILLSTDADHVR